MKSLKQLAPVVLTCSCMMAHAQPQQQTLRGVVVDQAGKAISGASVTVLRDGTQVGQQVTDEEGAFTFSGRPRQYRVEISATGFQTLHSSPVPFRTGGTTRFTLLQPGTAVNVATTSRVREAVAGSGWDLGVLAQGGIGTEDRSDYKFFSAGAHAGKLLFGNLGSGLLAGNFEYAVEAFPLWQSYTPRFQKISCTPAAAGTSSPGYTCSAPYTVGGTYTGVSVTPIILRWNFTHGQRWMPWVQGAGGVIWTNHKYPPIGNTNPQDIASNGPSGNTSVWNFTPQFGIGTHYFVRPRQSVDFSANAVHISSASLGDKNPGVNASVQFTVGYSWWK